MISTTIGAIAGLAIGAAVGICGMMFWHHGGQSGMDHGNMPMDHAGMMGDMPMTGNPDYDFMAGMVPHHQSAIDMANTVLQTTTDPQIKALAEDILAAQAAEIAQMNDWLAAHPQ
ncbi:DUF305 domain-containing protein [Loktanella sp. R86503]|uniref:DUF305 domain-containing protein n=1 Tax=Loktanella sp. R86503 TaxID=3093847 RepID=UPI0036DE0F5B